MFTYLPEEESDAHETVRLIEGAGRKAVALPIDLRSETNCSTVIDRAVTDLGGIDVLVNNAAYQMAQPGGLADITTEQLERVFTTNVYAMFWLCKAALPHLQRRCSDHQHIVDRGLRPCTDAAGLRGLEGRDLQLHPSAVEGARRERHPVNAVAPGPIWTPLIPATMPPDKVESFGTNTPLGGQGQPAELAAAYVYLASSDSSYVTGQRIAVTGGRLTP